MNQATVLYNPFLPELKITVNGRKISDYSTLTNYKHRRIGTWCDSLLRGLYREMNSDYELLCISSEFVCDWLRDLAGQDPHCVSFTAQPLRVGGSVYDRLEKLELLGYDGPTSRIVVPIVNASGDPSMPEAVCDVLQEQGIFEDISPERILWPDCPLADVEFRFCSRQDRIVDEAPFVITLCTSEHDDVLPGSRAPVYALVMGTRTGYVRKQGSRIVFTVEPDDIGKMLIGLLEEEALSALISRLPGQFSAGAVALLTPGEKEDLDMICQADVVCRVCVPQTADLGRTVKLESVIYPRNCTVQLRAVSDRPEILEAADDTLLPRSCGTAAVSVFAGDDPYPVEQVVVTVQRRVLIAGITLFPGNLSMPLHGSGRLEVTITPADAQNRDEIRWMSSDSAVARVDPVSGVIRSTGCGRCVITAFTQEASVQAALDVRPPISDILCPGSFMELNVGEQKSWRYQVIPENAYGADMLRVQSSDKRVAEYRGGFVLARGPGECRICVRDHENAITRELHVSVKKGRKFW